MNKAYLRVSTEKQEIENQKFEIQKYSSSKGFQIDEWIIDFNVSGKKKSTERKLWDSIQSLTEGDCLVVTEISRIGRDWFDILTTINECLVKGIHVHAIKNGYELKNDAMGKLFVSIMAVFAEEERKLLSERIKMSLSRKKKEANDRGERFKIGRKIGYRKPEVKLDIHRNALIGMLDKGISINQISKTLNCNRITVNRYIEKDIRI